MKRILNTSQASGYFPKRFKEATIRLIPKQDKAYKAEVIDLYLYKKSQIKSLRKS